MSQHRRTLVAVSFLSILALAFALGACGKSSSSTSPYVAPGGGGGGGSTSFSFSFPATGASASYTFATAGTYNYHCVAHAGMTGSVVVDASAAADSDTVAVGRDAAYAQATAFKPSSVTIKPGGHVRWVNRSSLSNHSAVSP